MERMLGNLERQLFAYAQMRNLKTFRTGDLCGPLGITAKQERELFSRLSRARLIASVRRGLYLVPPRLPLGALWTPDETLALTTLMDDREGQYQICGPNAFNRYGFDEQIPNRFYVYNNRLSGERLIGAIALSLIKVSDVRIGDTEATEVASGSKLVYSSRTRTLVDAVYDWSRFDSLPRGYEWIRRELSAGRVEVKELVRSALRFGNQGTFRRLGVLLEDIGVEDQLLARLERNLRSSKSLILWIPGAGGKGRVSRRWGVICNGQS
jgi:predicted transcriptional regulator of viral defense system